MSSDDEQYEDDIGFEEAAEPTKKKRANKPKKDPERPKGALSAYMCFSKNIRPAILEANPGAGVTVVAKLIGEKWGTLSEEDKLPFKAMAAQDKKRYEEEMAKYEPTPGFEKGGKKRAKKDPNAPKRPKSAYFLYCDTRRAKLKEENPEMKVSEVAKATGAEWQSLSEHEKKPFVDQAEALKAKYAAAMAEYKEK